MQISKLIILLSFIAVSLQIKFEGQSVKGDCPPDSKRVNSILVPDEGLPFCSEYSYKSCCSTSDTLAIKQTVTSLMRPECSYCYAMVSEWKCAECHPKAGIFYEGSADCDHDTSLKLCEDYCKAIFDVCKDIPFSLGDKKYGAFYLNDPKEMTADDFCENVVAEEPNCFRGKIPPPDARDNSCKCPDHKCHQQKTSNSTPASEDGKKAEL